ncbi:hypothetical protein TorRG33x02_251190, partial [Trema orientale]
MTEFYRRANEHMRVESSREALRKTKDDNSAKNLSAQQPVNNDSKSDDRKRKNNNERESSPKKSCNNDRSSILHYNNFTELTVPLVHVYAVSKEKLNYRTPPPIKTEASRRDPKKYYQFHKDIGHDTNRCFTLKSEVEDLIQRGYLN